ncbi:putative exoribonuclease II transcription factor C2H2 family [Helianthus anomalus]
MWLLNLLYGFLTRNKCAACYRQFNKKEHLVEHMRISYHSVHEPMCGICGKRCRSFESLREHLIGPLPKAECERVFRDRGCTFCLNILSSPHALRFHQDRCQLSRGNNGVLHRFANLRIHDDLRIENEKTRVVALACKMVGGGSDGSLDLCARICIIDEYENILFHSYVKPQLPVTNYRYESTGIRQEYLRDAMPIRHVQRKIQDFLCNGEPIWKIRSRGGKARILVGHGLDHDMKCLELEGGSLVIEFITHKHRSSFAMLLTIFPSLTTIFSGGGHHSPPHPTISPQPTNTLTKINHNALSPSRK